MPNYKQGKIYKVINTNDNKVYIGSTVKNLNDRMANHRNNIKNDEKKKSKLYQHIKKVGKDKFKIKLVKNYPCNNLNELKTKEFNEMKKINKKNLLNKNTVYKKNK